MPTTPPPLGRNLRKHLMRRKWRLEREQKLKAQGEKVNIGRLLRSKTVWAGIAGAAGYLLKQPHIGTPEVLDAAGMVLGSAGIRDAISKVAVAAATGVAK